MNTTKTFHSIHHEPFSSIVNRMNILVFNPYGHLQHNFHENILGKKFENHRHNVSYIRCGGFLSECDLRKNCGRCKVQKCASEAWFSIKHEVLDHYLTKNELPNLEEIQTTFNKEDFKSYTYMGQNIHNTVESSLFTMLRMTSVNFENTTVMNVYKKTFVSGIMLYNAINNLINAKKPDLIISFNGRMYPFHAMLAIAKDRNIPIYTLEQGFEKNTTTVNINHKVHDYQFLQSEYQRYKDQPISKEQWMRITELFHNMELGKKRTVSNHHKSKAYNFKRKYFLQKKVAHRKMVAVLTSSEDEHANMPEYQHIFRNPTTWLDRTIEYFSQHPDLLGVIRLHPNSANDRGAESEVVQFIQKWKTKGLPSNVELITPQEPVNTYMLLELADCALTAGSTITLEMIFKNKPVLLVRKVAYYGLPFIQSLDHPDHFEDMMNKLVDSNVTIEQKKNFYRFMTQYLSVYSIPFRLNHIYGKMVPFLPSDHMEAINTDQDTEHMFEQMQAFKIPTHISMSPSYSFFGSQEAETSFLNEEFAAHKKSGLGKNIVLVAQNPKHAQDIKKKI
ncbi:MAG: hypothetical protein KDD46_08685, partial [Bdellovibrionales bacterium]|nr:hypothetical protein [Bdellovibrionales bacterium]